MKHDCNDCRQITSENCGKHSHTPPPTPLSEATGTDSLTPKSDRLAIVNQPTETEEWEEKLSEYLIENRYGFTCKSIREFLSPHISSLLARTREEERNKCKTLLNSGRQMYEKGKEEERQAWLDGRRCTNCGGEKKTGDENLIDLCSRCLEEE